VFKGKQVPQVCKAIQAPLVCKGKQVLQVFKGKLVPLVCKGKQVLQVFKDKLVPLVCKAILEQQEPQAPRDLSPFQGAVMETMSFGMAQHGLQEARGYPSDPSQDRQGKMHMQLPSAMPQETPFKEQVLLP
jgi:hypothetical protein